MSTKRFNPFGYMATLEFWVMLVAGVAVAVGLHVLLGVDIQYSVLGVLAATAHQWGDYNGHNRLRHALSVAANRAKEMP